MDPIPAPSQNNQSAGNNKLNPLPVNLPVKQSGMPENDGGNGFNIKVPPKGILNSPNPSLNLNGIVKSDSDKNIKIDLDLNSAPLGMNPAKNIANAGSVLKSDSQPVQNNSLPPQVSDNGYKNSNPYKLSNSELQGPKPPLVPYKNRALIFILVAGLAISALAIGGYYIYTKNNNNIPVVVFSPTPEPTINPALDSDSDTIPDVVEKAIGTNPNKMDTDDDSFNDLPEIKNGYSPLIAGAVGKYTPEQWQAEKDKIKAANKAFYEKELGSPAVSDSTSISSSVSPVAVKKCEFPAKIGSHSKSENTDTDIPIDKSSAAKGLLISKSGDYGDYNLSPFNINLINFLVFDTEKNAQNYMEERFSGDKNNCDIDGVKGFCGFFVNEFDTGFIIEANFSWIEGKTIKIIIISILGGPDSKEKEDAFKTKLQSEISLFVNQFKNCSIE